MTVIARFEVIPIQEHSMSEAIARAIDALDRFPVSYELTATSTVIEGESADQVFAAVQAAHEAIPNDRVITSVEIDESRGHGQNMYDRIESVERRLGRPARRIHRPQREAHQSRTSRQPQDPREGERPPEETRAPERYRERQQPMPTPHDNRM